MGILRKVDEDHAVEGMPVCRKTIRIGKAGILIAIKLKTEPARILICEDTEDPQGETRVMGDDEHLGSWIGKSIR